MHPGFERLMGREYALRCRDENVANYPASLTVGWRLEATVYHCRGSGIKRKTLHRGHPVSNPDSQSFRMRLI